jgi:hypothetical protein
MFWQHIAPNLKAQEAGLRTGHNTWQLNESDARSQALSMKKIYILHGASTRYFNNEWNLKSIAIGYMKSRAAEADEIR